MGGRNVRDYSTLFRLDGRVAIVVGAASGIGAVAARGLAAFGATVVCADVNQGGAREVAREIQDAGGQSEGAYVDITNASSVSALFGDVAGRHGRVDVLVATPSVNVRRPLLQIADDDFERVVGLNLKGTFRLLRAAGGLMASQERGSIILMSSIRAQVVEPGQGVYAATKAGIIQMGRALAAELGPRGVRVNAIAPGVVDTPLTRPIKERSDWYEAYASKSALGRWAAVSELAGPVVFLASDASSYVTGAVLFVDGGWTAVDGRFAPPL
jgi:NAD(P)-dependent dehydrogenase (short-subunit alcohol dehydrogenase family)